MMANAKRIDDDDIWRRAVRRLCKLEGFEQTDPLHRGLYGMLAAYEQLLTEKSGRTIKAIGNRQKLRNKGGVQCLEDGAISRAPIGRFGLLIEHGLVELTDEYLVLKCPGHFSTPAVAAAKTRLHGLGVRSRPSLESGNTLSRRRQGWGGGPRIRAGVI